MNLRLSYLDIALMKSFQLLLVPLFLAASASADILAGLNPYLRSSRPDYDPAAIEPESAIQDPGFAPFSPADSDLGVQQILGSYKGRPPVNFTLETSLNYTTSAPGEIQPDDDESWFSASRMNLTWSPRITRGWFADIGLAQELFRFEESDAIDFENFEPHLGVLKSFPEFDDLIFFARYEYQRITGGSISESDYSGQRIRIGLQKDFLLTSRHQFSTGLDGAFGITANDEEEEQNNFTADLSYTYWIANNLSAMLSWTGTFWDYQEDGREDLSQIMEIGFRWTPCDNAVIYNNLFYTNNSSNADFGAYDYDAWQTGIGIGVNFSF